MSNKTAGLHYVFQGGDLPIHTRLPRPGFEPSYEWLGPHNFDQVYNEVSMAPAVSYDTETTSLYIDALTMVGFSFAYDAHNYVCLINHAAEEYCFTDFDRLKALTELILTRPVCYLWNASFDLRVVQKTFGTNPYTKYPVDVMALVFLADTNVKMPALKDSALSFLGIESPTFEDTFGKGTDIQQSDPLAYGRYAGFDSYNTYQLGQMFQPEISSRYPLPYKLDRMIIPALMYFEDTKSDLDTGVIKELQVSTCERIAELQSVIYDTVGVFLLTSTQQLTAKLVSMGYDTGDRTKTGKMSVAIDSLAKIQNKAPWIKTYIEYKKLVKLNGSYLQQLLLRQEYGIPHRFHYILHNAPTMRLAAGAFSREKKKANQQKHYFTDMNIQAISKPKTANQRINWDPATCQVDFVEDGKYLVEAGVRKNNLRRAWVVPDNVSVIKSDWVYWAIDYAGQELRILAALSGEQSWIDTFNAGGDVHKETAIRIWGPENYNKDKRKKAKIANFGTAYGGGVYFLMNKLGMTEPEALEFQAAFKGALPALFAWIDKTHDTARLTGSVITPYGVPRRLSYYYLMGRKWAGFADRSAANTMIQGSAGMIIRLALTKLFTRIAPAMDSKIIGDFHGDVEFRECIHDEIGGVCRRHRFHEFIDTVVPIMTDTIPKSWPLKMEVEVSVGPDWGSIIPVDHHSYPYTPIEVAEERSEDKALIAELTGQGDMSDGDGEDLDEEFIDESSLSFFG